MTRVTARLADFVTEADMASAQTALAVARLSLLDWITVGIAGCDEPVAQICRDMVVSEGGTAQASLFGHSTKLPARAAALANGTASHALDYDDTHFGHIGHPSVAVFPAAIAVAEREGASFADFLEAALIGKETSIRVGLWLGRSHYQTGFHQTATAGAFGATAACARLMGLNAAQTAHAFGLTATRASGLKAQFGTMGKPFNAGMAAANGVESATLTGLGFQSNPTALEDTSGFGDTHAGAGDLSAFDTLGTDWLFETVSHKFHACCHGLHATLEALACLPEIAPDTIARIDITTHPRWMTVCHQVAPTTGLGAKFSYTTVTAMALLDYSTAKLDSFSDAVCADPKIEALRAKVHVTADDAVSETGARVRVTLQDGTEASAQFDLNTPMQLEDRRSRVIEKSRALLGAVAAERVWTNISTGQPLSGLMNEMSSGQKTKRAGSHAQPKDWL